MKPLKKLMHMITGNIRVPREAVDRDERIILHVSDTPNVIHGAVGRLIRAIRPEVVIHTGDLVDNIKLELSRRHEEEYLERVQKILKLLSSDYVEQTFISLGNHDSEKIIPDHGDTICFFKNTGLIEIHGLTMEIGHKYTDLTDLPADFKLFGHTPAPGHHRKNQTFYLNGNLTANIIFTRSLKVLHLPYPFGTDDFRQKKRKIGL